MNSLLARNDTKSGTTMTPMSHRPFGPKKITPQDSAAGARVRSMRMERKMSQESLAQALGVTFQQVQKYEKGVNRLSGARLMKLAEVFECPISSILGTSEQQMEQSLGDKMTVTRRGCLLAAAFIRLEAEAQEKLAGLAEWLLEMQERGK